MKRRTFLSIAVPGAAGALLLRNCDEEILTTIEELQLRLILRGGKTFLDGRWQTVDVGIDSAGRLHFGPQLAGTNIIELKGKIISPGFVDILADNSIQPEVTNSTFEKYKITDGVTTALQMHGGSTDCGDYYQRFDRKPHFINYGVSTFVMGIRSNADSLASRKKLIEKNLAEGALGVSHSLEYQPAPFEEVLEYARLARKYDRPLFLHLRYSSREQELDGVDEAIQLAQKSGARVHIDHLHSTGGTFHMSQALDKIRTANSQGLRITTCVYPYSYWATYLSNRRFDSGWQQRYGLSYGDLRLVGTSERLTAGSFARYRKSSKLVAVPEGTMPLNETVDLALKEDFCMIASDGGIQFEPRSNSHPRGAGCFATAIRHALDVGMKLETVIEKVTSLPCSIIGNELQSRGKLEEGKIADLTVFDPAQVNGQATVEDPNQFSAGIELVIVNGEIAYQEGKLEARNGRPIRAEAAT
jgi:N-acyl-D-aspartate/D-glutamate deacylase